MPALDAPMRLRPEAAISLGSDVLLEGRVKPGHDEQCATARDLLSLPRAGTAPQSASRRRG